MSKNVWYGLLKNNFALSIWYFSTYNHNSACVVDNGQWTVQGIIGFFVMEVIITWKSRLLSALSGFFMYMLRSSTWSSVVQVWFATSAVLRHYRNQWKIIVSWTLENKRQRNLYRQTKFPVKITHLKIVSLKWWPFCSVLNVLKWHTGVNYRVSNMPRPKLYILLNLDHNITETSHDRHGQHILTSSKNIQSSSLLCEWNSPSPVTGGFPHKATKMRKAFPYHDVIMSMKFAITLILVV